jgi:hypothetical protein
MFPFMATILLKASDFWSCVSIYGNCYPFMDIVPERQCVSDIDAKMEWLQHAQFGREASVHAEFGWVLVYIQDKLGFISQPC